MLTLEDCLHFSTLDTIEINAIAMHNNIDDIIACELVAELSTTPQGCRTIIKFIMDDIMEAESKEDHKRARDLHLMLNRFTANHKYI